MLAYDRTGTGPPLVLLHGLGSSRRAWDPVVPRLAARFDVVVVDLPGHGGSAPLPPRAEPHPAALARAVGDLLDRLGIADPHVAGNSLGGWVALELAQRRPVASITLLSPAGLWRRGAPLYSWASLRASRWVARHGGRVLSAVVGSRAGRTVVMGQTHGRPWRLTPAQARTAIAAMGRGPGVEATLEATRTRRFLAGRPFTAPVTVAFGSRDLVLLRRSRDLGELPRGTRAGTLAGCGHVPMFDDPAAVAALVAAAAGRVAQGTPAA